MFHEIIMYLICAHQILISMIFKAADILKLIDQFLMCYRGNVLTMDVQLKFPLSQTDFIHYKIQY